MQLEAFCAVPNLNCLFETVPKPMRMMIYKQYLTNRWYDDEKKEFVEDTNLDLINISTQLLSKTDTVPILKEPK